MADPKIRFYYNLSSLLHSGVPILRAIALAGGSTPGKLLRLSRQMEKEVREGMSIADSMAAHPKTFDPFDIEMIRAGEETGQLSEILAELSRWHDFRRRNRRTIQTGMLLPIVIIHLAALLVPVLSHPRFYMGGPDLVGYLLGILTILSFFYIPAALFLAVVFLTPKKGPLRCALDALITRIPLLGSAARNLAMSRYCKTFALTYGAGVPIVRAARMAAAACGNQFLYRKFKGATEAAEAGESMSAGFSRTLDPEFRELWLVGEEAGRLDSAAERLGNLYAQRAESRFRILSQATPWAVYAPVSAYLIYKIFSFYLSYYGRILQGM